MAPKQKIVTELTLELEAGNAAMVDLGKMLGPQGVNTVMVKKEYDAATAAQRGEPVPVVVTIFENKTFSLRYKTPPTSFLIRKAVGRASGSAAPGRESGGVLTKDQVKQIAERKMTDLNANDIEAAMKIVAGSARSMGVSVEK